MRDYVKQLKALRACKVALNWLVKNDFPTLQAAWDVCERGDWMMWLVDNTTDYSDEAEMQKLTLARTRFIKYESLAPVSQSRAHRRAEQARIIRELYPRAPKIEGNKFAQDVSEL